MPLGSADRRLDPHNNLLRDLVLDGKDIDQVAIKTLRPQMMAGGRINELSGDADPIPCSSHAVFDQVASTQFFGDTANRQVRTLVGEA